VNWRAALVLLRHGRLDDPSCVYAPIRNLVSSPIAGESYAAVLRETVALCRQRGLLAGAVPPPLPEILRHGSPDEAADAAAALILLGSSEAADAAREVLNDRGTPAYAWSQAARVLGEIGERKDLALLLRAARRAIEAYGPEDLRRALDAFLEAAGTLARPEDAGDLANLLAADLPASTAARLVEQLETLTGERFAGDLGEARKGWREYFRRR